MPGTVESSCLCSSKYRQYNTIVRIMFILINMFSAKIIWLQMYYYSVYKIYTYMYMYTCIHKNMYAKYIC